jgi:DNA-binding LacI/PurR family transcriptional regulator
MGIVAISTWASPAWLKRIHAAGLTLIGGTNECDYGVRFDYPGMVEQGVAYLAERGCRRLALFYPRARWVTESPLPALFERAIARFGLTAVAAIGAMPGGDPDVDSAARHFQQLWEDESMRPDGLLVLDEVLFQELAFAMLTQGIRLPTDLQVITHANRGSNVFGHLPVARLEVDPDAYAAALADMAAGLIHGLPPAEPIVMLQATVADPSSPVKSLCTPQAEVSSHAN